MEIKFTGKKIMVTGAGQGSGRHISQILHKNGAQVFAVSKTIENLQSLAEECPGIVIIHCDLSNWDATERILGGLNETMDGLVNCASTNVPGSILSATKEDIERMFAVDYRGMVQVIQVITKKMIESKKSGSIVNFSSILRGNPGYSIYASAKAAILQFTKDMGSELGPFGIRVNSISPTYILTDEMKKYLKDPSSKNQIDGMLHRTPLRRFCTLEDVGNVALFLLSDKSEMVNGTDILLDGGFYTT